MALNYLLSPTFQIVNTAGKPATGGYIEVYISGDREKYYCASDFNGTLHPFRIPLDALGSNIVLAELGKAYDVYIYNRYGSLLMSRYNVQPSSGGGIRDTYRVISTDGSIEVDTHTFGNRTDFDIGIAPGNNDEFLEWVRCFNSGIETGPVYPAKVDGSMETDGEHGLHVGKDRFFHITSSFTVDPTAHGISYKTLTVALMFSDGNQAAVLATKKFDVDTSVEDPVIFEFAQDYKVPADGYIYWEVEADSDIGTITANMQAHRIYSGINAVPDTCATKQWVGEYFQPQSGMTAYVPFSGISGVSGQITGISGSAIRGHEYTGVWPVNVDNTADKISVTHIPLCVDETMTGFRSGDSAVIGVNTGTVLSGLSAYVPFSSIGVNDSGKVTAINGSGIVGTGGSDEGVISSIASAYAESAASSKMDASASSSFYGSDNPSGFISDADLSNYATTGMVESSVSGKMDASASSSFYPNDNPSGFITGVDLSDYATTGIVESAVSGKFDASASGEFYPSGNPSGFITGVDLSPYQPVSAMSAYQPSGDYYSATNPSGFITGVDLSPYARSADVSGTVRLVSSQSANWGGSALRLSAGAGISLTLKGNILLISTAGG